MKDYEILKLETQEAFSEFLEKLSADDRWVRVPIDTCAVVGVGNSPIEIMDLMGKEKHISSSQEAVEECAAEMGWLLVYPDGDNYSVTPTRYTSYTSICQRAGISGRTIKNTTEKKDVTPMSPDRKAAILSEMFKLYHGQCQILIREGKVSAMRSAQYLPISQKKAVETVETELRKEHPDMKFKGAEVSHEYTYADYAFNDEAQEVSVMETLKSLGVSVNSVKAGFRLSTSDVGNSALRIRAWINVDGLMVFIGKPIEIRHEIAQDRREVKADFEYEGDFSGEANENNTEKVFDTLKSETTKLASIFQEAEDKIEELGNIEIKDVAGAFQRLVLENKELPLSLAKTKAEQIKNEFPSGGSAIDVFFALSDLVSEYKANNQISVTRYLQMAEVAASCMFANYKALTDVKLSEEWK